MFEKLFSHLFSNEQKPDFWDIRASFIEYVEEESEILKVYDFAKKNFAGIYIGYNPDNCKRPQSFLSAGINHLGDRPEDGRLDSVILSAYWTTFPETNFADTHFFPLERNQEEIQEFFGFEHLSFRAEPKFLRIGIYEPRIDLTDEKHIHSHFKWIRQNLEKLYWLINLHESGCLKWE